MINGTKLLSIGNIPRDCSNSMLEAERTRHVVRICPAHLKGVWIPFERALELAVDAGIVDKLYPLFVYDIGNLLYHPSNHARAEDPPTGKLEAAADSRA
jgi:protein SOK2